MRWIEQYRLWTDYAGTTNADKIPDGTDPSTLPVTPDTAVWYLSTDVYWATHQVEFECVAQEIGSGVSTEWVWSYPQDVRGEKGDQGPNGDYFFYMFNADDATLPATNANLATMRADGWVRIPPATGVIYMTLGRFNGATNPPQGDGYPPNAAVPEDDWSAPRQMSANDGGDGDKGWSPALAVVVDGARRVHQLVDWIGGAGTKPGNIGEYLGPLGFVVSIGNATDIRGDTGDAWFDADWIQIGSYDVYYRKDTRGIVYLKGSIVTATAVSVGTLPVGYRPKRRVDQPAMKSESIMSGGGSPFSAGIVEASARVTSSGTVTVTQFVSSISEIVSFDNISFYAEN